MRAKDNQPAQPPQAPLRQPQDLLVQTAENPSGQLPLLMVDIDGVISLFGFDSNVRPPGRFHAIDGIPHFISFQAASHLLDLRAEFELVWASGWEEKANEYLPHLLGLPGSLPYLSFDRSPGRSNAHWKLDAIEAHAGTRPLAWIDDSFNDACHAWADSRSSPTLLVQTTPSNGLTRREAYLLSRWAEALLTAYGPPDLLANPQPWTKPDASTVHNVRRHLI